MALRDVTGVAVSLVEYASGDPVVVREFDSLTTLAASRVTPQNVQELFGI